MDYYPPSNVPECSFIFQKTGARIKIYSNTCPRSTDRLISICGKPTTCIECIRELIATIKTVSTPRDHGFAMNPRQSRR